MSIAITDTADPVITGDAFSYTVILTNDGAAEATSVAVVVTLDASLTYISASGDGWSCTEVDGVVTCVAASIGPGAAPAITIDVSTGDSAISASSSVVASAANAADATASQTTVVQHVDKDATAGIYFPSSATQWSAFLASKGLAMSPPDSCWLVQEPSGSLFDSIGSLTLLANGTPAYQQAVAGYDRKAVVLTVNTGQGFRAAAGVGPNPTTTSSLWLVVAAVTGSNGAAMAILTVGGAATSSQCSARVIGLSPPSPQIRVMSATTGGASDPTVAGVQPIALRYDLANSVAEMTLASEKVTGTYNSGVTDGFKGIGSSISGNCAGMAVLYAAMWSGANAEVGDAALKALEQAMGFTITR
jgi:uncharacterized repeat protein (TIGR01451 family)